MDKARKLIKAHESAKSARGAFPTLWRESADYVRPVKSGLGTDGDLAPRRERLEQLFDTTTIDANQTYAAGCMSWMTPSESTWFSYDPPEHMKNNDEAKSWFSTCTDITQQVLAKSNFYQGIHEIYLDDGGFGTSGMLIREGGRSGLTFQPLMIGSYSIMEDEEGNVDTVFRELHLTHRQAAQRFGEQNLDSTIKEALMKNPEDKAVYLHYVGPRSDADREFGKIDAQNMPFASIYVDVKNKHLVKESGSWEMSIACHRHAKWGGSPYGFAPAIRSLVDSRQLNSMQELLDSLVEKQVTPPVMVPASYKGKINLMAGGYTYFKSQDEKPQFWNNPGNYLVGEDRVEFRKNQINKAFHVDLFQALASVPPGKEMTASEVMMRQRDRLTLFSPTFARKNTELNTPIMMRVFSILLRTQGAFPPPPEGILIEDPTTGFRTIPAPQISYTSRLALQMKAIKNEAYMRSMDMIMPLAQVQPDIIDHFDSDKIVRGIMRNEGVSETWIRPQQEVDEIRFERAKQAQEMQQREAQLEESQVVSNLAKTNMLAEAA